ncbi:putative reverse transcriptase domain-containing protein [Tanacetum coccineum]
MQEVILFYNGLEVPTRQILDSKGVIPSKTAADAKVAIQEMAEYSKKWHNGTSRTRSTETFDGLATIQAQLNNLRREIKKVNEKVYAAQVGCEQCKGPHYTKDYPLKEEEKGSYGPQFLEANSLEALIIDNAIPPRREKDPGSFTLPSYINNACFYNGLADLGASVSVMPLSTYLNLGLGELAHTKLTVELANRTVKYPKGITENVLVGIGKFVFPVDFIILDMPKDVKVPLILGRPLFLPPKLRLMYSKGRLL